MTLEDALTLEEMYNETPRKRKPRKMRLYNDSETGNTTRNQLTEE